MTTPFIHLRAHTEYSITESTLRIGELISKAKADGQPAVAMTDLDGFFGAIRFYQAARKEGIAPIIGTDIQIAFTPEPAPLDADGNAVSPNPNEQPPRRALLIAKNYEGYLKLMRLISKGYTSNLIKGKPVIREEWLRAENPSGIYCLSGGESGHIGALALSDKKDEAMDNAKRLQSIFGDNFFLEIQRRGALTDADFVSAVSDISQTLNIPLLATHPIQFAKQEDYVAHELKVCDASKQTLPDRNRERNFTPYQHFTTTAEMHALFPDFPDAIENAQKLALSCSLDIPLGRPELPDFQTGTDESLDAFFTRVSNEGLQARLLKLYPDAVERAKQLPIYQERLDHEISTIKKMGFEGYFMIVYDFIKWAHEHEIPVGPGRGSGAGSLVAYSLRITDLDPLKYNLLFERFLNPERVSMPDFDIDFCTERRELVIDYVTRKYGTDAVAGITAVNTLASRSAIGAAGRALGMNNMMVQTVSKLVPNKPGQEMSVKKAIEEVPEIMERYDSEPEVKRLLDHASTLEGLPKAVGKHAAGVVIARGRIADYSPVYVPEGETKATTQYDKDDLEQAGLVKFDFLAIKELTMIDKASRLIRQQVGNENFDISNISLEDPEVYKLFQRGDTEAVFQFGSGPMQSLLRDAQPSCIEDLTALNALYRPGPMDLIPEYLRNKAAPNMVTYLDPRMKDILKETYGIMVYQEQVMQIAQVIGGYTLGAADLLRRAMGKKKPEEMIKHRQIFSDGAQKNGLSQKDADEIFSHMEKFAGYGFNKSHSAAYSVVAYQTAYLKAKHPGAYFAAALSVESVEDIDAVPVLIANAQTKGLTILAPDINLSESQFTTDKNDPKSLRYGLAGLKNVGVDAVQQVLNARKIHGDFTSLEDFMHKCSKSIPLMGVNLVNKTVVERLIMAGSFDALHPNRAESLAAYPLIDKYNKDVLKRNAKLENRKTENALGDLFAMSGVSVETPKKKKTKASEKPIPEIERYVWPECEPQPLMEKLENEKKSFGFYFSGHPMAYFKPLLGDLKATESISELLDASPSFQDLHLVAGVISDFKAFDTKNGKMVKGNFSDGQDSIEFVAFADAYAPVKEWFKKDEFALFTFQVKEDKFKGGLGYTATKIRNLSESQMYLAQTLHISTPKENIAKLRQIAQQNPGQLPITLWHPSDDPKIPHAPNREISLSIELTPALLDSLKQEFGKHVKIGYPKTKLTVTAPPRPKNKPRNY